MKREYSKTPNGALERWSVFLDEKIRASYQCDKWLL